MKITKRIQSNTTEMYTGSVKDGMLIENGVLVSIDAHTCPSELVIPDSVTSIGDGAFYCTPYNDDLDELVTI